MRHRAMQFWRKVVRYLADTAQQAVEENRPLLGRAGARVIGRTACGDVETAADEAALSSIERRLRAGPYRWAMLDEQHGVFRDLSCQPELCAVVDELDGTRPHAMGLPTACVSIAAFDAGDEPVLASIRCGVLASWDGSVYAFVRGDGLWRNGERWTPPPVRIRLAQARFLFETMHSSYGLLGLFLSAFERQSRNGILSIASTTYAATRLAEGSVHAHMHLGHRLWEAWPALRPHMESLYGGVPGQHVYDVAAAVPLLWEAGRVSTDARGRSLRRLPLNDLAPFSHLSASGPAVHRAILQSLDEQEQWMLDHAELIVPLLQAHAGKPG